MTGLSIIVLLCVCPLNLASLLTISHAEHETRATPGDDLGFSVLKLNKVTFTSFVLDFNTNPYADHVFVHFCLSWWQPCRKFVNAYTSVAHILQDSFNTELMRSKMRFAYVDCATDKDLCNIMGQDTLPAVVHFAVRHGSARHSSRSALSSWYGSGKDDQKTFMVWVKDQLDEYDKIAGPVSTWREHIAVAGLFQAPTIVMKYMEALLAAAVNETDALTYVDTEGDHIKLSRNNADISIFVNGHEHAAVSFLSEKRMILISRKGSKNSAVSDVPDEQCDAVQRLFDTALAYKWLDACMDWIEEYMLAIELLFVFCFCAFGLLRRARRLSIEMQETAQTKNGSDVQRDEQRPAGELHE